jgi:hypothetical protein
MVAWRMRNALGLDHFGAVGSSAALTVTGDLNHPDNIIFDIKPNPNGGTGISTSDFGHPTCLNNPTTAAVSGPASGDPLTESALRPNRPNSCSAPA